MSTFMKNNVFASMYMLLIFTHKSRYVQNNVFLFSFKESGISLKVRLRLEVKNTWLEPIKKTIN